MLSDAKSFQPHSTNFVNNIHFFIILFGIRALNNVFVCSLLLKPKKKTFKLPQLQIGCRTVYSNS